MHILCYHLTLSCEVGKCQQNHKTNSVLILFILKL